MVRSLDRDVDDPFALALLPPADETPQQRTEREAREIESKRISDEIDEALRLERVSLKKKKRPVKVLLLGQSESGKSTTLKNFQLTYARKTWQEERVCWRPVVQLNLVRSITLLLDLLSMEIASPDPHHVNAYISPASSDESDEDVDELAANQNGNDDPLGGKSEVKLDKGKGVDRGDGNIREVYTFKFTERHRFLKVRLGPLRSVQRDLMKLLGAGSEEPIPSGPTYAAPFEYPRSLPSTPSGGAGRLNMSGLGPGLRGTAPLSPISPTSPRHPQEFYVRSSTGWRGALEKIVPASTSGSGASARTNGNFNTDPLKKSVDDTTAIIAGCKEDMRNLWEDPVIKAILVKHGRRLEDEAGFFLDDIDRIANVDYVPSDDDIIRARLRTMGVQEYRFVFDGKGMDIAHEWIMYDVGGTRTLRQAWAPFFTDINAIIFLAPISCFDQKLAEDPAINRLEDSFILWKAVSAHKLLATTQLVLFMNKCDLLERKLKNGTLLRRWVTSYGDRKNEASVVVKYLKTKFRDIAKQNSPQPRPTYIHPTSVIDTKATAVTLSAVREGILRDHLRDADFL